MAKYFLSIDNGLTTTKSVLFNLDGQEIASYISNTEIENKGDFAEIDMELQWDNTAAVIHEVICQAGIEPAEIIGIGNSGHGAGLYLIDEKGLPIRKAISSMDGRAASIIDAWAARGLTNYQQTYQNMWIGQPVPILYWLKKNEPVNYQKIAKAFMAKDWIKYKLTGTLTTEYTDASNSGLINLNNKGYDRDIFNPFGVAEIYDKLPNLYQSTDIVGIVNRQAALKTGLKEGTPVIGGLFDVTACALGGGVYNNDQYSITAGTWNINAGLAEQITPSKDIMEWVLYADTEKYMCIDSSATSAVNLEWFLKNILKGFDPNFDDTLIYHRIDRAVNGFSADEVQIIFLPFIYKSKLTKCMEGSFFGIKASHNVFHLLRAVYEGVAFAHLLHLDNLRKSGIKKESASFSGGASKSEFWCHLFADVLNIEIVTTKATQVGALGTAIATAVAVGVYPNLEQAIKVMVKEEKRYQPGVNNRAYMEKYQEFKRIIDIFNQSSPTKGV